MFDINQVPRDPDEAVLFLIHYIGENKNFYYSGNRIKKTTSDELSEFLEVLRIATRKSSFDDRIRADLLEIADNDRISVDSSRLLCALNRVTSQIRIAKIAAHFDSFAPDAVFSLDDDETAKIAGLVAEMRQIVNRSGLFSDSHRVRLLNRISQVETEIHRKDGRFDVILGGVVDFGDALGKFGKKVKPLVDRMSEIRNITQRKSHEYQQLPPPDEMKQLPAPNSDAEID